LVGQGLEEDVGGAYEHFEAAARGGDEFAAFNLGFMHLKVGMFPQPVMTQLVTRAPPLIAQ
jgi:SEL1 protein